MSCRPDTIAPGSTIATCRELSCPCAGSIKAQTAWPQISSIQTDKPASQCQTFGPSRHRSARMRPAQSELIAHLHHFPFPGLDFEELGTADQRPGFVL